jgi:hypothetical protein
MPVKKLFGIGSLLMLTVGPASGSEPMDLKVSPLQALAPATMQVRATVEHNAANRALEIVADGENFYRSSLMPLEGERAPRTFDFALKALPAGEYVITAILTDASGREISVLQKSARVIGY